MISPSHDDAAASRPHRAEDIAHRRIAAGAGVWTLVLAGSVLLYAPAVEIGGTMPWLAALHPLLFGLTIWPVLRAYWSGQPWYTVSNSVLILIYAYMGFGSANYILAYESIPHALPALRQAESAADGMMLVLLGTVAFRAGAEGPWLHGVVRRLPPLPPTPPWSNLLGIGLVIGVLLAIAMSLVEMQLGVFGYGGRIAQVPSYVSMLRYASGAGMIALTTGFFYWIAGAPLRSSHKALFIVCFSLLLLVSLLKGMKQEVLVLFLTPVVPYVLLNAHGKARVRPSRSIVVLVPIFVMVLFAVTPAYRAAVLEVGGTKNRLAIAQQAIGKMTTQLESDLDDENVVVSGADTLADRMTLYGYFLAAVRKSPNPYEFRGWERYDDIWMTAIVPRSAWPDKPIDNEGVQFQQRYILPDSENSTTPTVFGWSYIEGGVGGVILLLLALGLSARFLQLYTLGKHGVTLAAAVALTYGLRVYSHALEADPYWLFNGFPKETIACVMGYWVVISLPRLLLARA